MSDASEALPVEVDCESVRRDLAAGDVPLLLDCREQDEYDLVHIAGATLLPMSEIQDRLEELADHRNQRVVVYCHHGGRSLRVASWLRGNGFSAAQSMSGGIDAWAQVVDTSLPRY